MSGTFKLLQNLAGLFGGALILAFAFDWLARTFGFQSSLFCWALTPALQFAYVIGWCLAILGLILWAFTFFRNEKPLFLAIGGAMLAFLPVILPHYLGVDCVAPPAQTIPANPLS
ncbi:hypothetical protein C8J34_12217 [Rhizobium sp. PP-F2F-G36]|nr:hypothetical protein C8J34_12217 [Rhizobium sp. PP-F2F-G36]